MVAPQSEKLADFIAAAKSEEDTTFALTILLKNQTNRRFGQKLQHYAAGRKQVNRRYSTVGPVELNQYLSEVPERLAPAWKSNLTAD